MTEPFDAVLAEMRGVCPHEERFGDTIHEWADRLAAAHAAEVAKLREACDSYARVNMRLLARAEAAERDARELGEALLPLLPVLAAELRSRLPTMTADKRAAVEATLAHVAAIDNTEQADER